MDKLLTFSIAAYNVEKTLPTLMNSLLAINMLEQIEILVVNDGSKDNTLSIAKEYEKKYPECVRVIDKENGGHGSTINTGIACATGKYFRPIDGDDWIVPETGRLLIKRLHFVDSDIILMDYLKCYEKGSRFEKREDERISFGGLVDGTTYPFEEVVSRTRIMGYHSLIYRTDLLRENEIHLDEHCFYVDTELNLLPVPYVKAITYYAEPLYCYRYGAEGQSVNRENRKKHIKDSQIVVRRLLNFYKIHSTDLSEQKRNYLVRGVRGICVWHFRSLTYFRPSKAVKDKLRAFDSEIYGTSKEIYRAMVKDINDMDNKKNALIIFLLRGSGYVLYPVIARGLYLKERIRKIFHEK